MASIPYEAIHSLQRSNRLLRAWLAVVSLGLGILLLMSLVSQNNALEAKSVTIRDDQGRARIVLGCLDNRPLLALFSESGATLGEFTLGVPLIADKSGAVGKALEGKLLLNTSGAAIERSATVAGSGIEVADAEQFRSLINPGEVLVDACLGSDEKGAKGPDRAELSLSVSKRPLSWSLLGNQAYEGLPDADKDRLRDQWLPMPRIQLGRVTELADAPSLIEIGLTPELHEGAISRGDTSVGMGDVDYTGQIVVKRATGRTVRQSMTMTAGSLQSLDMDKDAIQRFS